MSTCVSSGRTGVEPNLFRHEPVYLFTGGQRRDRGAGRMTLCSEFPNRRDDLLTSTLSLAEVLVKPVSAGDVAWADRYEKLLSTPGVSVLAFDRSCARIFAQIRQDKTVVAARCHPTLLCR